MCRSTDTKLDLSTRAEFHSTDGVDIGGVTCSMEYWTQYRQQSDVIVMYLRLNRESKKTHMKLSYWP